MNGIVCEFGERTSRADRDYSSSSNNHLTCRVCPTLIKSNFPCFWVAFRIIRWRLVLINIWLVLIIVLLYPCSKVHGKPSKQLLSPFIHSFIHSAGLDKRWPTIVGGEERFCSSPTGNPWEPKNNTELETVRLSWCEGFMYMLGFRFLRKTYIGVTAQIHRTNIFAVFFYITT